MHAGSMYNYIFIVHDLSVNDSAQEESTVILSFGQQMKFLLKGSTQMRNSWPHAYKRLSCSS